MPTLDNSEIEASHLPCPDCGSSDALTLYADGHTHCFSCETTKFANGKGTGQKVKKGCKLIPLDHLRLEPLKKRKIQQSVCQRYGYYISEVQGKTVQVACYYDDENVIVGQKLRDKDKHFSSRGKFSERFFGQHLWRGGGKKLIVTEGEIDCLTVSQVNKGYPCVSLPCGATSAAKVFKAQLDWLEMFEEVIVMFDNDEAGRKAVKSIEGLVSPNKLKVATLPYKDANECLQNGKPDEIIKAIWNAKLYKPDGIINGAELWDCLINTPEPDCIDYPWGTLELNKMTKGIRKGEMLLLTAGTGIGKSTIARELAYDLGVKKGKKVGLMMLEENKRRTCQHLMGLHLSKRIHLFWDKMSKEELKQAFDETLGTQRFVIYDHFGSVEGESLLKKIRYMAVGEQCDFIVLDHISIAVSGLEGNDERKQIDIIMTNLRSLIEEVGVGVIVICHVRKTESSQTSPEEGGSISLNDLRGSGTLKQIPDTIIAGERNQQEDDCIKKNTIRVRCLKCRFTGNTGIGGYLYFDSSTGRLDVYTGSEEEEEEESIDLGGDADLSF